MQTILPPYDEFYHPEKLESELIVGDHLGGFDKDLSNHCLRMLDQYARTVGKHYVLRCHQIHDRSIKDRYPNLTLEFDVDLVKNDVRAPLSKMFGYTVHPEINYQNFLCSFNGAAHVGRKLLVAALHKFGYYHPDYCSKNFAFDTDILDGHIKDYVGDDDVLFRKFFISQHSQDFFDRIDSFGHVRFDHANNIYTLESKLTQSFLHLVSETMPTSYYPFVTEKFLYSIVTRGLFLTYGQPGWHDHLERYYGFKKYTKLFDYTFDRIQNPVSRLIELLSTISRFQILSKDDWMDLYLLEVDTIEYNYDHYMSRRFFTTLENYVD